MTKKVVRIGSRDSKLAVIQSQMMIRLMKQTAPDTEFELITMKTTGDIILDKKLDEIGGKGLFVKELDEALLSAQVDLTVHSLKDMPAQIHEDLPLLAFSQRENPFDALVLAKDTFEIDYGKPFGCSSARRALQLKDLFGDIQIKPVRGNVTTRLAKLDSGEYGALTLACAGLIRLGLGYRMTRVFKPEEMLPAAGQGIVVVQGRRDENYGFLEKINDVRSKKSAEAERAFVRALGGDCSAPVAAYAEVCAGSIALRGLFYDEQTGKTFRGSAGGDFKEPAMLGEALAKRLQKESGVK